MYWPSFTTYPRSGSLILYFSGVFRSCWIIWNMQLKYGFKLSRCVLAINTKNLRAVLSYKISPENGIVSTTVLINVSSGRVGLSV
jgi:hypothetical protein